MVDIPKERKNITSRPVIPVLEDLSKAELTSLVKSGSLSYKKAHQIYKKENPMQFKVDSMRIALTTPLTRSSVALGQSMSGRIM